VRLELPRRDGRDALRERGRAISRSQACQREHRLGMHRSPRPVSKPAASRESARKSAENPIYVNSTARSCFLPALAQGFTHVPVVAPRLTFAGGTLAS
jgi:hypothetical protein